MISPERLENNLGAKDEEEEPENKTLRTGFIAQDVMKAANEIGYDFDGIEEPKHAGDYYGLRYSNFVPSLVQGMKEQQEMIEWSERGMKEQQAMIERLEREIQKLNRKIKELKRQML